MCFSRKNVGKLLELYGRRRRKHHPAKVWSLQRASSGSSKQLAQHQGHSFAYPSCQPHGVANSCPSEPPLASKTGGTEGLVTDAGMHWWSRAREDRSKQIPSLHQNIKNWRLYKIISKRLRFFTSLETWVSELYLIASVAKQFPSLRRTIGMQRGKYCPASISLLSHSVLLFWGLALHCYGHANTPLRWPSSWGYWGVEDFIWNVS